MNRDRRQLNRVLRFLLSRWSGFALVALLLLAWQEAAVYHVVDPVFIPPLTDVMHTWIQVMRDGSLMNALVGTILRFVIAYTLSALVGIIIGTLLGYWRLFYALLEPTVELLRPLPPPAIIPIFILLLGIDNRMKITVVVFAAIFPIIVNAMQGVRGIDPVLMDTGRTYGFGQASILRRIVLPAALPSIFAGLRISLAIALIVTVFAEMLAGTDGVGYFVLNAERGFDIPRMYAGVITLAALGYILNAAFMSIERVTLHWYTHDHRA